MSLCLNRLSVALAHAAGDNTVQRREKSLIEQRKSLYAGCGRLLVKNTNNGGNPRIKVLLLHGGPAATHEYMECFESFFPKEGFEFYEYDQLGAYYSDQPKDSSLWTIGQ